MENNELFCYHGSESKHYEWKQPTLIASSEELSRPGYSRIKANEFRDAPAVMAEKVKLLAEIIKSSQNCVVYTGAGVSRASGIADYASKAKNSIAGQQNPSLNRLLAKPTIAHHIITEMAKQGYIKHWLQQNHDGLAQKSGFPSSKLNQIHGSWFDKKNSVVLMDDKLNPKNFNMLEEWEAKVDICLALGTSLCGMRSDGVASDSAKKDGLVIINLQQTPYDEKSRLRIYGNLQQILSLLAKELKIKPKTNVCLQNPSEWNQ